MRFCLRLIISVCVISLGLHISQAQPLPPCTERPHWTFDIRAQPELYCVETVWQDSSAGEMAFTGLAFAPDGRLFAARPLQGQVMVLRDTDGDRQPDSPQVAAEGLDRPNALLYYNGALYIAGGRAVYRLRDGEPVETLTDALPGGTGLWNGGLTTDGTSLYVGIGACDACNDPLRGTIVRLPLDGGEAEVYATGFRQPLSLLWHEGSLWATDSLPVREPAEALDELNQVVQNGNYGYPACVGLSRRANPNSQTVLECETTLEPVMGLPTGSQPSAVVPYTGEAFPHLQGSALIAFMGSTNRSDVQGYGLMAFPFPPPAPPFRMEILVPYDSSITSGDYEPYWESGLALSKDMVYLNRRGVGLWPHHLYGLAVSPEGWIYMSIGGGTLLSLRPR